MIVLYRMNAPIWSAPVNRVGPGDARRGLASDRDRQDREHHAEHDRHVLLEGVDRLVADDPESALADDDDQQREPERQRRSGS